MLPMSIWIGAYFLVLAAAVATGLRRWWKERREKRGLG
jgi:hypothetical protein